jgi:hypothetical protein
MKDLRKARMRVCDGRSCDPAIGTPSQMNAFNEEPIVRCMCHLISLSSLYRNKNASGRLSHLLLGLRRS